jgi:hypothetical protein
MLTVTPTQASYQIGDTVTVADPANDLFANPGDSVQLLMFGDDYSDVLETNDCRRKRSRDVCGLRHSRFLDRHPALLCDATCRVDGRGVF